MPEVLYDLAVAMTADHGLGETLQLLVDRTREILGTDTAYVALRDEERRDVIAFEMAERGDSAARASLLRIVQRDNSAAKRERAAGLLAALDAGGRTA